MARQSLTIQVPATSANLGPGFDCLALALGLYNQVTFEVSGQPQVCIHGEGRDFLPKDHHNLIIKAMNYFTERLGLPSFSGISIQAFNQIPTGSGLGSSASAVLAGLLAANQLSGRSIPDRDILLMATELEGHPDNAAAALWGGLVIVVQGEKAPIVKRFDLHVPDLVVVVPDIHFPTIKARKALPTSISIQDAVFNIGRAVLTVEALRQNDQNLLSRVMEDRIHQPYRLKLLPGAEKAIRNALDAGASACVLSGAGPGLIAFTAANHHQVSDAMRSAFAELGIPSRCFVLPVTNQGARVI